MNKTINNLGISKYLKRFEIGFIKEFDPFNLYFYIKHININL